MGLKIREIVSSREITLDSLKGKRIAIDSYNMLYQFLTTIRSRDGSLLINARGDVTSHLTGLFSRIVSFLEGGIHPIFVFDGKPPSLKHRERERRKELKQEAEAAYHEAAAEENVEAMRKYASRTARITPEILSSTHELIDAFGLPQVQAPSEGEAQVAFLVKNHYADYAVSQDFDTLLYGAPFLIRNLSLSQKRKKPGTLGYEIVTPEVISLRDLLETLAIDQDQLIVLAILTGTDYNYGGVKGIGQKKALGLVKKYGHDYDALFSQIVWDFPVSWKEIYTLIKEMPVDTHPSVVPPPIDLLKITSFLCDRYDFNKERVEHQLSRLESVFRLQKQKSLSSFFS